MFRPAHCSLIFFVLKKGKEKNPFLFFFLFTATEVLQGKQGKEWGKEV